MLSDLFLTFFKIGFISFGGGYAMIPVIGREVLNFGWLTGDQFTDAIAVSGMSPGPIAMNIAIFVGYKTAGIGGAVLSAVGMAMPSVLLILFISVFFLRVQDAPVIQSAFYGLRPVIVGLILFGAIHLALQSGLTGLSNVIWIDPTAAAIFFVSLLALFFTPVHPAAILVISGIAGLVLFS